MNYEQGIRELEALITDDQYLEIDPNIRELERLLREERLFGSAPETSQKRFRVIAKLNQFMRDNGYDQMFTDLSRCP